MSRHIGSSSDKSARWSFSGGGAVLIHLLVGMLTLPVRLDAQERVLGVDISYWNCGSTATGISQANWNTGFTTGNRKFAYIRATRGGTTGLGQTSGTPLPHDSQETLSRRYDDPRFIQNISRATAAGMVAGPYHFARPDVPGNTGVDEANHFMEMAGIWMRPGYMMPMFDQEAGEELGGNVLVQFALDFSDQIYAVLQIRPCIYINGNYSSIFQAASLARRNALAQPLAFTPSMVGPAYPMLWDARYSDNTNPDAIPVQTGSPKTTYTTLSVYYGPWDDYGNTDPWSFWQYSSTTSVPGFNNVDSGIDSNVSHGDMEYVRNYLVPAVWWNNSSGDWSTLTNWNSGQPVVAPVTPPDQTPPYATGPLPIARLPGAAGIGPTSGQYDTVILERPTADITVTVSAGTHNIRKLYMREALNITGGALIVNYDPTYRPDTSTNVLHGGLISAQFSGPVTIAGGSFSVHTLQVDAAQTFTVSGGALTFATLKIMPGATPAKLVVAGNPTFNPLASATATLSNVLGAAAPGFLDLSNGTRTITVGNGVADVDVSLEVPLSNGALIKAGPGTMRLTAANTYNGGTTISAGRLLVNNTTGSGTGSGTVLLTGGTLGGTGTIAGTVTVLGGSTIAPGTSIGTLTLNSAPTLSGITAMEIDRNGGSPLADKIVLTSGTLNYGGTLVVTNIGAALAGGEVFTLFNAPAYSDGFATSNLPALNPGLNWYLGDLTVNGSIKVNRAPSAGGASFTNDAPETLQIPLASLLATATDADGDVLSVASIQLISTNGVSLSTNAGFILYSNYVSKADQINYTLSDGRGGSVAGAVQIKPSLEGRFASLPQPLGNAMTFQFVGSPGWIYYLERSTNLPDWVTIWTNAAPVSGLFNYTDTFSDLAAQPPAAFYRLRWSPQ